MTSQTEKRTYVMMCVEIIKHFLTSASKRPDTISIEMTVAEDGTFDLHYGKMVEQDSTTLGKWLIQAAKAIANGLMPEAWNGKMGERYQIPIDVSHVNGDNPTGTKKLSQHMVANTNASDIKTVPQAIKVVNWQIGNSPNTQKPILWSYVSAGKAMISWARDPRLKAEKDAGKKAAAKTVSTTTAAIDGNALKVLLDSGMDAAEAVALLRGN